MGEKNSKLSRKPDSRNMILCKNKLVSFEFCWGCCCFFLPSDVSSGRKRIMEDEKYKLLHAKQI